MAPDGGPCGVHNHTHEEGEALTFRYVTFDCYGTLIDWKRGISENLGRAMGGNGPRGEALMALYLEAEKKEEKGPYRKYREILQRSALDAARRAGVRLSQEEAAAFASSVPEWPAFSDTSDALRELGLKGYKRFILSNIDGDLIRSTIKTAGLEIDGYVTAEDTRSYKPAPGHWLRFMEVTGAERSDFIHAAQSVFHDIVPTGVLGISSAWVNRYGERLPAGAQPEFISDSLAGLVAML